MNTEQRQNIIKTIVKREKLRPISRITRLFVDPVHALPYYILATISHIKPFKKSFRTLWGDKMIGYLPEANTFYYYGFCEANLTSFLLRFIKEGSVFIDVGSHIGFYSVLISHLIGSNGKIFAFEPTPWTYDLLKINTSQLYNVFPTNAGVSNNNSEISFSDFGPGYGAYNTASSEGAISLKSKNIKIKTIQLDSFFEKKAIIPDFIKLDAEGFETNILNGLSKTLKTSRPLITLEMAGDKKWAENCTQSSDILLSTNYIAFSMTNDGYLKKCTIRPPYTYTNILFVPSEKTNLISNLII